jgi:GNAT superfamily N-acetyltransferase
VFQLIKRVAKLLFGRYRLIRVYTKNLEFEKPQVPNGHDLRRIDRQDEIEAAKDQSIRERAWYSGENALGFGLWDRGSLACTCFYWTSLRFRDDALGPVTSDTAVLMDMLTAQAARGQGYASIVLAYADACLKDAGYRRLLGWVWHSNLPSIRTFEKSGWTYAAFVVEIFPFGRDKPLRFRWAQPSARKSGAAPANSR